VGAFEAGALALVEATLKYHPDNVGVLTLVRYPDGNTVWWVFDWGGLLLKSTEECKGTLSASVIAH